MKMKKMIYMGALALIAAGGIFWSCQKDEFETYPENGLMLKAGAGQPKPVYLVGAITPLPSFTGDDVTYTVTATTTDDVLVGCGEFKFEKYVLNDVWVEYPAVDAGWAPLEETDYVTMVKSASTGSLKVNFETAGKYGIRITYKSGPDCNYKNVEGANGILTNFEILPGECEYEGNLLTGEAISCDETREAIYTFSSKDGTGQFKIQGGLTNFTVEDATVFINGSEVVFDEQVTEGASTWEQGQVEAYTIGQRIQGGSSNRTIRVEGSLNECSAVVIRIVWNSTNSGDIITGNWAVSGENVGEVAPVSGLTCPTE